MLRERLDNQSLLTVVLLVALSVSILLTTDFISGYATAQTPAKNSFTSPAVIPPEGWMPNDTQGRVPGNPDEEVKDLKTIHAMIGLYQVRQNGQFPDGAGKLIRDANMFPGAYNLKSQAEVADIFTNPDYRFADNPLAKDTTHKVTLYQIKSKRLDNSLVGSAKPAETKDVWAWSGTYVHDNMRVFPKGRSLLNPVGFYMVLWADGQIQKVPYDEMIYGRNLRPAPDGKGRNNPISGVAFPGQAGVLPDCHTFDEHYVQFLGYPGALRGKPVPQGLTSPVPDNGGPEALVSLSRLLNQPAEQLIEREAMWKALSAEQADFTLADIQKGAAQLGLKLQLQNLTLRQLQERNTPVIVSLREPQRLITLAASGTDYSLIYDGGMARVVDNATLIRRYSGEALVSDNALPPVLIDNPIRLIKIEDTAQDIPVEVSLSNSSNAPLRLQIETPACGLKVAEPAQLSIQPKQTTKLQLKLMWRTLLPGRAQIVLVKLRSDNPQHPDVLLAFRLELGAPPATVTPASADKEAASYCCRI
jgi:hypothetical protein